MTDRDYETPMAVLMAREVLDLYEENQRLRFELNEAKGYQQKYTESLQHGINFSGELIGTVLGALIDPESRFNKGEAAIRALEQA